MRSFILLAATAALMTAGLDGCSRRTRPPQPLGPHKEPHALTIGSIERPLAQNAGQNAGPAGEAPPPAR
jgi:hypothetical protein